MPHQQHLAERLEGGTQATLAASTAKTTGSMRQLSRLGSQGRAWSKITYDHMAGLEPRFLAEGDKQLSGDLLEPGMPARELEDIISGESSITFAGPRLPRTLSISRANSFRLSRANSFRLSPGESGKLTGSTTLNGPRVGHLDFQPSQNYEAGTLVDESSQEPSTRAGGQDMVKELFAAAQHAQREEIAALTARLAQQEQQLSEAMACRREAHVVAAEQRKQHGEAIVRAEAQVVQLQDRKERQLEALASRNAAVLKLESELGEAQQRVEQLEAQATALEVERVLAGERSLRVEQEAARVAELLGAAQLLQATPGRPETAKSGAPSGDPSPHGAVIAAVRGLVGRVSAMQDIYLEESQQRQELYSQVEAAKAAPQLLGRNGVADRGGSPELKRLKAVADELRGQVAHLQAGTCTLTARLQSSKQQVQDLQEQLASSCSPRHLHRGDTLPVMFVRSGDSTKLHAGTPDWGKPNSKTVSLGGGVRGRLTSAPELDSVGLGGYSTWIVPAATTAVGGGESGAVPPSPTTATASTTELPCIDASPPGPSTPSYSRQQADAVPRSSWPCLVTDGQKSGGGPTSRPGPEAALQKEQHGIAPVKPQTLVRPIITAAPASKAASRTSGFAGQLRSVESRRTPTSTNPPCSPVSVITKAGGPSNPGQDNASLSSGSIKAWRPETAPGARAAKPAAKGRWS